MTYTLNLLFPDASEKSFDRPSASPDVKAFCEEESSSGDRDSLTMYLKEIRQGKPLSREEEVECAKRVEEGRRMMIEGLCSSYEGLTFLHAWCLGISPDDNDNNIFGQRSNPARLREARKKHPRYSEIADKVGFHRAAYEILASGSKVFPGEYATYLGCVIQRDHLISELVALRPTYRDIAGSVSRINGATQGEDFLREGKKLWGSARDELVKSTLPLVVRLAKKYRGNGVDFEDLIQFGNEGLVMGADRFDYTMGYRFSTYASQLIEQSIKLNIKKSSKTIRIPVGLWSDYRAIKKVQRSVYLEEGRKVSSEEISSRTKLSVEDVDRIIAAFRDQPVSLYTPSGPQEDSYLICLIADEERKPLDALVGQYERALCCRELVEQLEPRLREVVTRRFGLDGKRPESFREIGKSLGVKRQRIDQIEKEALRLLRKRVARRENGPIRDAFV